MSAVACLLVFLAYGFLSSGTYLDDDLAHDLIARGAWRHPSLFWNTWGRPAFTVLYAPAALLGFGAAPPFEIRVFEKLSPSPRPGGRGPSASTR